MSVSVERTAIILTILLAYYLTDGNVGIQDGIHVAVAACRLDFVDKSAPVGGRADVEDTVMLA